VYSPQPPKSVWWNSVLVAKLLALLLQRGRIADRLELTLGLVTGVESVA